jgi:hypothetical protein
MMKTARDERLLCKQTDWKKNNLEKCYCLFSKGVLVRTGFPLVLIEIIDRPSLAYNKEVNFPIIRALCCALGNQDEEFCGVNFY